MEDVSSLEFQKAISVFIDAKSNHTAILSGMVSVSMPTVRRWKDGVTAAYPTMRPLVIDQIQKHACTSECGK